MLTRRAKPFSMARCMPHLDGRFSRKLGISDADKPSQVQRLLTSESSQTYATLHVKLSTSKSCFRQKEDEEEFYTVPSYDKNRHVVVREALLVQYLNHRVHKSLSGSSLVLSNCSALRRTTTRLHGSVCVTSGLDCLFNSESFLRLVTGAAA